MPPSTEQWSLDNSFTSRTASKYGVTNLIHELILSLSRDVCTLKRNALTTYKLLNRASTLYNEITSLIETVETETDESWETYDKYTLAIAPLEDLLLKLCRLVDLELDSWLPTDTKVAGLISSVQTWQNTQSELRELFDSTDGLYSNTNLQALKNETIDAKPLRFRDNLTFLNALCREIGGFELGVPQKLLTSVKELARQILPQINGTTKDESTEQTVRSLMLVYGVMVVLKAAVETDECKTHLASKGLWMEAEALLSSVIDHLSLKPTIDVTTLKSKVDTFIASLAKYSGPPLPNSYWKLKKAVQNVRRPYHAQTLAAVKQARELAEHISKLKPENQTSAKFQPFEAAIDAVEKALLAAASVTASVLSFDPQETQAQAAKGAFELAEQKLTACFSDYNVTTSGMSMAEAKALDDKYVTSVKSCFNGGPKTQPASKKVNIELIRVRSGVPKSPKSYSMDESTSLSAILWKEAGSDSTVQLQSSHFKLDPRKDEKLHLDTTLQELGRGRLTVYLVD